MAAPIGNQFAKRAKIWEQAIKRAIARRANGVIDHGLDELADKLIALVAEGDLPALKELGDRLDGKPAQSVALDGDGQGGAIKFDVVAFRAVDAVSDRPTEEG
jgi:hypothetical protein